MLILLLIMLILLIYSYKYELYEIFQIHTRCHIFSALVAVFRLVSDACDPKKAIFSVTKKLFGVLVSCNQY